MLLGAAGDVHADAELDYGLEQTRLARIELSGNATFGDRQLKDVLRLRDRDWTRPLSAPSYRPDLVERLLEAEADSLVFAPLPRRLDDPLPKPAAGR